MKTKHLFLFLFVTILSLVGFTPKAYADEKDIKIGDLYYDLIESEDSRYAEIKSHFFWIGYIERTFGSEYDAEETSALPLSRSNLKSPSSASKER